MALSSGKMLLIFKACATSLVLDFCSATDRWLQLNGYILSFKCLCVCKRKGQTINIVLLKTNKETVTYQIRTSKQYFLFLILKKTERYTNLYYYLPIYRKSLTKKVQQRENCILIITL